MLIIIIIIFGCPASLLVLHSMLAQHCIASKTDRQTGSLQRSADPFSMLFYCLSTTRQATQAKATRNQRLGQTQTYNPNPNPSPNPTLDQTWSMPLPGLCLCVNISGLIARRRQ